MSGCAAQEAPTPVCGQPGVLDRVAELLRVQGQPIVLDAPPVGEVSGALPMAAGGPPVAHCSVRAHTIAFDTNRFGNAPLYEPFIVRYTTELRPHGLFVRLE